MEKAVNLLKKNAGTLLAAAVALLTALVLFAGGVNVRLGEDALRVSAVFSAPLTIAYDDIRAARLAEDVDFGQRLSGLRSARVLAGRYLNDAFGGYALYAYADAPLCIDLTTDSGHVVLSAADEAATQELFGQLTAYLPDIP